MPSMCALSRLCLLLTVGAAAPADDLAPPRSAGMQTLVVPDAQLDLGEVFYLEPGVDTQLAVQSYAPLQATVLTSRRAVGYIVTPFVGEPDARPLLAGALRIPAASLTSGAAAVDEPWHGPALLAAAEHPEIEVLLRGVRDVERIAAAEGERAFRLTADCTARLRGAPREFSLPLELRYAPFTWQQMRRNVGDLWQLRFEAELAPAELGVELPPPLQGRVADRLTLRGALTFSTVSPDKSLDPTISQEDNRRLLAFVTRLRDFADRAAAYRDGRALLEHWAGDAGLLRRLAETVLEEGGELRDYAFVRTALEHAAAAAGPAPDARLLGARGELAYRLGELSEAAALTAEALAAAAGDGGLAEALQAQAARIAAARGE